MGYKVCLTRVSDNSKTGPIPVSTTESSTCPKDCVLLGKGCYGENFHLKMHWDKIDKGERGVDWETFCGQIRSLPRGILWRHNQAGDLPGDGLVIDTAALETLVDANRKRRGFTYTHYDWENYSNLIALERANRRGFTINLSCDSLTESDRATEVTELPQAVVLPSTEKRHSLFTPNGRKVVVCPATYRSDVTCKSCEICYNNSPTRAVIGFPAHGTKKRVIDIKVLHEIRNQGESVPP